MLTIFVIIVPSDDWATSVETAIANALKKDGVQPPMPSISHRHDDNDDDRPSKRKRRERQKVCGNEH